MNISALICLAADRCLSIFPRGIGEILYAPFSILIITVIIVMATGTIIIIMITLLSKHYLGNRALRSKIILTDTSHRAKPLLSHVCTQRETRVIDRFDY